MKVTVTKVFKFSAAHQLVNHDGKCAEEHGHNYTVELTFAGKINNTPGHPKQGMVIDFGYISSWWRDVLDPILDHQNLNKIGWFVEHKKPTTAEYLAIFIWDQVYEGFLHTTAVLEKVRVWETDTGYAEVSAS